MKRAQPSPLRGGSTRSVGVGGAQNRALPVPPPPGPSGHPPRKGEGNGHAEPLEGINNPPAAYPPCCCVPKSTFGGCMASSETVKFWKGSLPNQSEFQRIDGKVLSEVL
jgi:hypothetical protein